MVIWGVTFSNPAKSINTNLENNEDCVEILVDLRVIVNKEWLLEET
jgi:hypothetical protein